MAGTFPDGRHSTDQYALGRGIGYFAEHLRSDGRPLGFRDLGNLSNLTLTTDLEEFEHASSRTGLREIDLTIPIQRNTTLSIEFDNTANMQNLRYLLLGEITTQANTKDATNGVIAPLASATPDGVGIQGGRWYELYDENGVRMVDIQPGVTTAPGTPEFIVSSASQTNVWVEGTGATDDYVLERSRGRIWVNPSGTQSAAAISAGDDVTFVLDNTGSENDGAVDTLDRINSYVVNIIEGAFHFFAENPLQSNTLTLWQFHLVQLSPTGDFPFITEEGNQTFTLEGTAKSNFGSAIPSNSRVVTPLAFPDWQIAA